MIFKIIFIIILIIIKTVYKNKIIDFFEPKSYTLREIDNYFGPSFYNTYITISFSLNKEYLNFKNIYYTVEYRFI